MAYSENLFAKHSKVCPKCSGDFIKIVKTGRTFLFGLITERVTIVCDNCNQGRIYPKKILMPSNEIEPLILY